MRLDETVKKKNKLERERTFHTFSICVRVPAIRITTNKRKHHSCRRETREPRASFSSNA